MLGRLRSCYLFVEYFTSDSDRKNFIAVLPL